MAAATPTATQIDEQGLRDEVRAWLEMQAGDWDELVEGDVPGDDDCDLWDAMPAIDSKTVARTTEIFERHLKIKLDVKLIRPGGYESIDDVIDDLVPKMIEKARGARGAGGSTNG